MLGIPRVEVEIESRFPDIGFIESSVSERWIQFESVRTMQFDNIFEDFVLIEID